MVNMVHPHGFPKADGHRHQHVQKVIVDLLLPEIVDLPHQEFGVVAHLRIVLDTIRLNRQESIAINTSIEFYFQIIFEEESE
jgi:hypothetical protein